MIGPDEARGWPTHMCARKLQRMAKDRFHVHPVGLPAASTRGPVVRDASEQGPHSCGSLLDTFEVHAGLGNEAPSSRLGANGYNRFSKWTSPADGRRRVPYPDSMDARTGWGIRLTTFGVGSAVGRRIPGATIRERGVLRKADEYVLDLPATVLGQLTPHGQCKVGLGPLSEECDGGILGGGNHVQFIRIDCAASISEATFGWR